MADLVIAETNLQMIFLLYNVFLLIIKNSNNNNVFIGSGCEAKDSQESECNHYMYTNQEPYGEKTRKEVSVFDVGEKPTQSGRACYPINIVPPVRFEPGT